MEFKVGDRVRVIDNGEEDCFGLVGTIENTAMDFMDRLYYKVDIGKELPYVFFENQLELYEEKEEIEETKKLITLDELLERIEKLEKCVMGEQNSLEKCENVSSMSKNGLLTEDERVILRNLDKDFKFIARNTNGDLNVFEKCPKKREYFYSSFDWSLGGGSQSLDIFPNLFQFIKNTDEPYNIEELLKGESEE